jgi:uncharacterized membrane protein (UPF0127 family)
MVVTIDILPKQGWQVDKWVGPVFNPSKCPGCFIDGTTAKIQMDSSQMVAVRLKLTTPPTATPVPPAVSAQPDTSTVAPDEPTPTEVVATDFLGFVSTPQPTPTSVLTVQDAWAYNNRGDAYFTPEPSPTVTPTDIPTSRPTATPRPTPAVPLVNIGDATFTVDLATTGPQRSQGLSGRDPLAPGAGMLFVFPGENRFVFWMKEMRFPLDIVWINAECRIVDITLNAPAPPPDQALADLPRFSPSELARYVLEIHAGEAAAQGINAGDMVFFGGTIRGEHGC